MRVFQRQPAVPDLAGFINVVVHQEQARVRLFQQTEPDVQQPQVCFTVVLNVALQVYARCEGVADTMAEDLGEEVAGRKMNIVEGHVKLRIEAVSQADAQDTGVEVTSSAERASHDGAKVYIEGLAGIRDEDELRFAVVVGPGGNNNAFRWLEGFDNTFGGEVDARVDLQPVEPNPVMVDVQVACLLEVVVVPVAAIAEVRTPFHQSEFSVHPYLLQQGHLRFAVRRAHKKSDFGIKSFAHFRIAERSLVAVPFVAAQHLEGLFIQFHSRRLCFRVVAGDRGLLAETPFAIDSECAVVMIGGVETLLVDDESPDRRTLSDLVIDACDGEVVLLDAEGGTIIGEHVEESDVGVVDLSRHAGAPEDGYDFAFGTDADPPGEEEVNFAGSPYGKLSGVLEEEGALLREEEIKAVEVDLLLVYFHLCEVGVVGQVERDGGGDAVFDVGADLWFELSFGVRFAEVA